MAKVTYDREITALVVIDPYNDFISEGGELSSQQTKGRNSKWQK